jgi:dehydrogenase/reductase SDR family member 7B
MKFSERIVWVTGASSGIGEATAQAFAREGAHLVLSSRRPDELARVGQSCLHPERHTVLPLDLTASETFAAAVGTVLARHGRIDVLINNGGSGQRALAADTTTEVERALMEVNYFGPVALTKAVLPAMRAQRSGHIVVISSVMGHLGTPGRSTYAAAKHALHGYFDSLRAELSAEGLKVTVVCPGYVKTAIAENALGPRGEKTWGTSTAPRSGISAQRCAAAILRAVDRASDEIYVGRWEICGIYLQRFLPWLLRRIVRKMKFSVHAPR